MKIGLTRSVCTSRTERKNNAYEETFILLQEDITRVKEETSDKSG